MAANETSDKFDRQRAGGFIPRHKVTYAPAGPLGADTPTEWKGQNAIGFRVGVGGDVVVTMESGIDVKCHNVQPGEHVTGAFGVLKSAANGTTAQQITVEWL